MNRPIPQHTAPELNIKLLGGGEFSLKDQKPQHFTLLIFYRGLHCPLCEKYLQQLQELLPEFEMRGVDVLAISMDSEKRARLARQKWDLANLKIGYELEPTQAKDWGLYLSKAVKDGEPAEFSEPGLFLIDSSNLVYYSAVNSNPWGRPYLASFVKAVDYIINSGYPARGEIAY